MGPRVGWWWYYCLVIVLWGGVTAALDGADVRLWFYAGALLVGGSQAARSLRVSRMSWVLACGAFAIAAAIAYVEGSWFWAVVGAIAAVAILAFTPKVWRDVPACRFRTEELVGRTVAQAVHLVGFDAGRAPGGLRQPVLAPIPQADIDTSDRSLVVTAVTVEPTDRVITFGVAQRDVLPVLTRSDRQELQRALVDLVGGFPADLRPLGGMAAAGPRSSQAVVAVDDKHERKR